ncbi:hypothetical protein FA95DRAFT_1026933 [Auriscalpium vulgare]|uniref:Uncharacterized protein n=1 Tax=Auriscalpium vulgare TaxID=40419 RepID=A0ACB8R5U8_9AGAM|nr:hypothetical protein FA95DRAFT_1026933 [Auriscalpium vulgare]
MHSGPGSSIPARSRARPHTTRPVRTSTVSYAPPMSRRPSTQASFLTFQPHPSHPHCADSCRDLTSRRPCSRAPASCLLERPSACARPRLAAPRAAQSQHAHASHRHGANTRAGCVDGFPRRVIVVQLVLSGTALCADCSAAPGPQPTRLCSSATPRSLTRHDRRRICSTGDSDIIGVRPAHERQIRIGAVNAYEESEPGRASSDRPCLNLSIRFCLTLAPPIVSGARVRPPTSSKPTPYTQKRRASA